MLLMSDTNILLRSAQPSAPEHAVATGAVQKLRGRGDIVYITPQNLVEFWSVATRPAQVNGLGLTPVQADAETRALEALFPLLPDSPAIHSIWRQLVVSAVVSGRQVHDARLAAVMIAHGITRILTFNTSDFTRYPGITALHPQDVINQP